MSWFEVSCEVTIKMSVSLSMSSDGWNGAGRAASGVAHTPWRLWAGDSSFLPHGPLHSAACVSSQHGHGLSDQGGGCDVFWDPEVTLPHLCSLVLITAVGFREVSRDSVQHGYQQVRIIRGHRGHLEGWRPRLLSRSCRRGCSPSSTQLPCAMPIAHLMIVTPTSHAEPGAHCSGQGGRRVNPSKPHGPRV